MDLSLITGRHREAILAQYDLFANLWQVAESLGDEAADGVELVLIKAGIKKLIEVTKVATRNLNVIIDKNEFINN